MTIDISTECYTEIEAWMEGIYEQYPFKRIYENGKPLGYQGFMRNFRMETEEVIQGVVEVRLVSVESGTIRHKEAFDKLTGQVYSNGELQGSLFSS